MLGLSHSSPRPRISGRCMTESSFGRRSSCNHRVKALHPTCSLFGKVKGQLKADFHRVNQQRMRRKDQGLCQSQTTCSSVSEFRCNLSMRRSLWSSAIRPSRLKQELVDIQSQKDWRLLTFQLRCQLKSVSERFKQYVPIEDFPLAILSLPSGTWAKIYLKESNLDALFMKPPP